MEFNEYDSYFETAVKQVLDHNIYNPIYCKFCNRSTPHTLLITPACRSIPLEFHCTVYCRDCSCSKWNKIIKK